MGVIIGADVVADLSVELVLFPEEVDEGLETVQLRREDDLPLSTTGEGLDRKVTLTRFLVEFD